jgi:hypothetical protein
VDDSQLASRVQAPKNKSGQILCFECRPLLQLFRKEIDEVLKFVIEQMVGNTTEINYVIEQKGK